MFNKKAVLYDGNHTLTLENLRRRSPEDIAVFESMQGDSGFLFGNTLLVIQNLLENGIDSVVDIGCGNGSQGYLFRAAGIRYVGIERFEKNLTYGEIHLPDDSIIIHQADWPCEIPEADGISTCVSMYSLGIRYEEHLAPAALKAMHKRFTRAYITAFPHAQAYAQQIWGSTLQWIRPYEPDGMWVQICERPKTLLERLFEGVEAIKNSVSRESTEATMTPYGTGIPSPLF